MSVRVAAKLVIKEVVPHANHAIWSLQPFVSKDPIMKSLALAE